MKKQKTLDLDKQVLGLIVPEEILKDFELRRISENSDAITVELRENKGRIPDSLAGLNVVLDGYCNPIELHSFPLKGKASFIKLYRRRWKEPGKRRHYSNSYRFADSGTKATHLFGAFLKGAFGCTPDCLQHTRAGLMYSRK